MRMPKDQSKQIRRTPIFSSTANMSRSSHRAVSVVLLQKRVLAPTDGTSSLCLPLPSPPRLLGVVVDLHGLVGLLGGELDAAVGPDLLAQLLLAEQLGGLAGQDVLLLEAGDLLLAEALLQRQPPLLAAAQPGQQVAVGLDQLAGVGELPGALAGHALAVKDPLALAPDLLDALHGLEGSV